MDILDEGLLRLWNSLNKHHVRYIMIGGFATRFHGFNRLTEDLDLWLEDTTTNRKNLRAAFMDLDYGDLPMLETMDFIAGWTSFTLDGNIELDILTEMKGLEDTTFADCYDQASVADINGTNIPFLHINQLIQNKKATNRPKDQLDVLELEKIRAMREGNK